MDEPLTDALARTTALDPAHSFIVEAAAGSGKTALLTQRFLVLLTQVAMPEEVVAITFTRKAAAEMRGRVLTALTTLAPATSLGRAQQILADAVLARDADRGWQLRQNPGRLRILTIDALVGSLVRRFPLQSGLAPGYRLHEDPADLYRRVARRTLLLAEEPDGAWGQTVRQVLSDLDNDWRKLESLLMEMLPRRDQWLSLVNTTPSRNELETLRAQLLAQALQGLVARCPSGLCGQLVEIARWIGQSVAQRAPDLPESLLATFAAAVTDFEGWRMLAELLLTKDGKPRRNPRKDLEPGPESDRVAWRAAYRALVAELDATPSWCAALADIRELPDVHYSAQEFERLCNLLGVLRLAAAQWVLVSAESGLVDFPAQSLAALAALGEPEDPTDLALALDYRLSHLLVDEFQDTSRIQYQLLERLTAGWTGTDGRTLFLVGDPLQSIYRFRDADVNLFLTTLSQRQFGNIPLLPLRLNANFRTVPAVLHWLNGAFLAVFAQARQVLPPFLPFQATRDDDGLSGVQIHGSTPHTLADQMLAVIRTTWREKPAATIAILVRSRLHLGDVPEILTAAGIPLATNDIDALNELPLISDLVALTRALFDLADRTAWLAVLRAPWCGLRLADLHRLLRDVGSTTLVWTQMNQPQVIASLAPEEAARLGRVRDILGHALEVRGRVPYATLVEQTWCALGTASPLPDADARRYAGRFFELLERLAEDEAPLTGPVMASRIAQEFAPFPRQAGAAVEIMTIHRAKGLEFDVVLLPELQRAVRAEPKALLLAHAPHVGHAALPLVAPLPGVTGQTGALYAYLRAGAKAALDAEGYRLLYVALTRARSALHLFSRVSDKKPPQGSFLEMLWPVVGEGLAVECGAVGAPPSAPQVARGFQRQAFADLPPAPPARTGVVAQRQALPFEWASPLAKPIGTVTHGFLQAMAGPGGDIPPAPTAIRARLRMLGLRGGDLEHATREVDAAIRATFASARGRWLFAPAHREAHSEYRLAVVRGTQVGDVILDRTFVSADGVRWIIDFKTSTHEGGDLEAFMTSEVMRYRPQLEAYARALAVLGPEPVMLGLYYPRLDAWREWPAP